MTADAVIVFWGLDNGLYYQEDEDGDRSLPKKDLKGEYHVRGRLEIGSTKQAKGLLSNCGKILGNFEENRKVIISPTVRYYRAKCCEKEGHVSNLVEPGYRKGMLEDLARIHEGLAESCREDGIRRYKMISPLDLLGISHQTEEDEVASLLGDSPVHMTRAGYALMAEKLTEMVEKKGAVFAGDKRRRDDSVTEEAVVEDTRVAIFQRVGEGRLKGRTWS